jgi:NAD(P)H-dependent FMN reductase
MATKKIALILSSTRTPRAGPTVVSFVKKVFETVSVSPKPSLEVVDLATFKLPVLDEPKLPAMIKTPDGWAHEHSRKWSAAIASYDAYIFVSPEYNFGVPGGVKNAIDFLYNEWIGKPVVIVTYGGAGGNNASDSLEKTLSGMKLRVVETRPQLHFVDQAALYQAAGTGEINQATLEKWEKESTETLEKAWRELNELLEKEIEIPAAH